MVQMITLEPDWGVDIDKKPQLEIRYVERRADGLYVLGISHSGIKVGDRFTCLLRFDPSTNVQDRLGDEIAGVSLRVESIMAYHNQLNRVNANMTAALFLSGDAAPLQAALNSLGWSGDGKNHHQWNDTVSDNDKLILTR